MSKLFSVLISVYHRERGEYLTTALASVFDQTVMPDEVVLVEDGPLTDELYAVIDDFKNRFNTLKIVKLPQNVGLGGALNQGLSACSYDLVARMDSDDICLPDRFEVQLKAFDEHPEVSVVGGWIDEFSTDPSIIEGVRKLPENHNEIMAFARSKNPMNHPSVMFSKKEVLAAGGYQHFYLLEDYWLWLRMMNNSSQFYNVQRVLTHMRGGLAMSARRGGWKYAISEVHLQRKMYSMGMINRATLCKNIVIRFAVRMMPNKIRIFVYKKFLRR